MWTALNSLASAPKAERTLTGLSLLLQSNPLRQALQPYTLEGPWGSLLDGADDRLSFADVMHFELETLMETKGLVLPVLTYLFHKLEARFDGRPTLPQVPLHLPLSKAARRVFSCPMTAPSKPRSETSMNALVSIRVRSRSSHTRHRSRIITPRRHTATGSLNWI